MDIACITEGGLVLQSDFIPVEAGKWKFSDGQILQTHGISSHVVAVVFNPKSGTGYMGHFTNPYTYHRENFDSMIEAISYEQLIPEELSVWISGASLSDDVIKNAMNAADKDYVRTQLQSLGLSAQALKEAWLDHNQKIPFVQLDCANGSLVFKTEPLLV